MQKSVLSCFLATALLALAGHARADTWSVKCGSGTISGNSDRLRSRPKYENPKTGAYFTVYFGKQHIVGIASCRKGVVTAFSGLGIYYSPDCDNIGGGGKTEIIYTGRQRVWHLESLGDEVQIQFNQGGVYRTKNCREAGVHCVAGTCL